MSRNRGASVRRNQGPHGEQNTSTNPLPKVAVEMALSVMANNLTRIMNIVREKLLIDSIARRAGLLAFGTDTLSDRFYTTETRTRYRTGRDYVTGRAQNGPR